MVFLFLVGISEVVLLSPGPVKDMKREMGKNPALVSWKPLDDWVGVGWLEAL